MGWIHCIFVVMAFLNALAVCAPAAQARDALVVHITCANADGKTTQGSGVLVSKDGHVLTAGHVAPDGYRCQASIGNSSLPKRGLARSFSSRSIDTGIDAMLMEFGKANDEEFDFATFCRVGPALRERQIIAKGYHPGSFGGPSATNGILSNSRINYKGIVETSAMTINGKSGGPVFLEGTDTVIGIIAGAQFNAQGAVSYYGMLASDAVLNDLDLLKTTANCDKTERVAEDLTSNPPHSEADLEKATEAYNRGVAHYNRGSYNLAIESFDLAITLNPKDPDIFNERGLSYYELKNYTRAITDFDESLRLKPDYTWALNNRGLSYHNLGEYSQALENYNDAIRLDPKYTTAFINRGLTYELLGQNARAIEDYDEAIRLNPNEALTFNNRGYTYYKIGQYQRALEDIDQSLRLDPSSELSKENRTLICANLSNC